MKLFEAHITYNACYQTIVEQMCPENWKFSVIAGDPDLGKDTYCYLTSHGGDSNELYNRMRAAVEFVHIPVMRMKIEKIIYDTKTHIDELGIGIC